MKLHLQLNLDQLGPEYQTGKAHYALIVSAALEPEKPNEVDENAVRNLLRLWTWAPFEGLAVYGTPADLKGKWQELAHTVLDAGGAPANLPVLQSRLEADLEEQLKSFSADDFIWQPDPKKQPVLNNQLGRGDDPRHGRNWRAFLTQVATFPGGLGLHLRLSTFFCLNTKPADDFIVLAAPVLRFADQGSVVKPLVPKDPGDINDPLQGIDVDDLPGSKQVFHWKYEPFQQITVDAYVNRPKPLPDENTAKTGVINLRTLWRNPVTLGPATNWLAQIADRMASSFDLPTALLKYLEVLKSASVPNDFPEQFRIATFETVRPMIEPTRLPPAGVSMLESTLYRIADKEDFPFGDELPSEWMKEELPDPTNKTAQRYLAELDPIWRQFQSKAGLAAGILWLWRHWFRGTEEKWKELEPKLRDAIEIDELRGRLLLHNFGSVWAQLFPSGSLAVGVELDHLKKALVARVVELGKTLFRDLDPKLETVLRAFAASGLEKPDDQVTSDPTSDGIAIQVDKMGGLGTPGSKQAKIDDHEDFLRRISGVGVLLRRKGATPWKCLNMASLAVRPVIDATEPPVAIGEPVAYPVRFQYAQGVRQSFITYLNQPLVAESPWSRMMANPAPPADAAFTPLFSLLSPYKTESWLLERLRYGSDYEAVAFYFGNAGELPAELCEPPKNFDPMPWRFALPTKELPKKLITSVEYRRRCPAGPLRIQEDPLLRESFPPALPERVHPLTPLLVKDPSREKPVEIPVEAPSVPLVLLLPSAPGSEWDLSKAASASTFVLRPPSLDVKVWERWQDDGAVEARRLVLGDYFKLVNAQLRGERKGEDPTLDDPAISGFEISFERVDGPDTETSELQFDFGLPAGATGLKSQQRVGRRIRLQSSSDKRPSATLQGEVIVVSVPDREIWRVDFTPVIDGLDRFQDVFVIPEKKTLKQSLTDPTSIHVEVATPLFATATRFKRNQDLHKSILLESVDRTQPDDEIEGPADADEDKDIPPTPGIRASLPAKGIGDFARLLHRTELLVQRWRWDGRPVYENAGAKDSPSGLPFDRLEDPGPDAEPVNDAMLFADRGDTDFMIETGAVDLVNRTMARLIHLPYGARTGVLYYRFAFRAFSRYEGLLRPDHCLDSGVQAAGSSARSWRRYTVPLRWQDRVPKPLVKLIVPLTETVAEAGPANAPGWLVLLDEPWYSEHLGGLGEGLESLIDRVALPDRPEHRPQMGPDPVVDMPDDPLAGVDIDAIRLPRPVGAFGWTFDTDSSAPLFVKSSFFQPPPTHERLPEDLSFYFVRVRFRRVLTGADVNAPKMKALESELTDPAWVQVLPPANRWRVSFGNDKSEWVSIDECHLSAGGVICQGRPITSVLPVESKSERASFQVYALITRRIFDAFGRGDQESFVGFVPFDKLAPSDDPQRRVRLIEAQFRVEKGARPPATLDGVLDALFEGCRGDDPLPRNDAAGRIIRMSPPIEMK